MGSDPSKKERERAREREKEVAVVVLGGRRCWWPGLVARPAERGRRRGGSGVGKREPGRER